MSRVVAVRVDDSGVEGVTYSDIRQVVWRSRLLTSVQKLVWDDLGAWALERRCDPSAIPWPAHKALGLTPAAYETVCRSLMGLGLAQIQGAFLLAALPRWMCNLGLRETARAAEALDDWVRHLRVNGGEWPPEVIIDC